jgi:hypothetical protein
MENAGVKPVVRLGASDIDNPRTIEIMSKDVEDASPGLLINRFKCLVG